MLLFLTYHKVQVGPSGEFYTLRPEQLEQQLDQLAQNGFRVLPPQALFEPELGTDQACVLSFDDATHDHLEIVLPLLGNRKHQALFFVPTAKLDRPGHLTGAELQTLAQAGHTIGAHSHEHRRMDQLMEEDIRVQIEICQEHLRSLLGSAPLFFAPPGGFTTTLIRQIALEQGIKVIRTMRWGLNQRADLANLECIPLNRHVTAAEFEGVLHGQSRWMAYAAKQITKKLLPGRLYETLREVVSGRHGRN